MQISRLLRWFERMFCAGLLLPLVLAQDGDRSVVGPGPASVDVFHPDVSQPLYGGRVIVHMDSLPRHMNYLTDTTGNTRRMLYTTHETLLLEDWEQHSFDPRLCHDYVVEDLLVLRETRSDPDREALEARYGDAGMRRVASKLKQETGSRQTQKRLTLFGEVIEGADGYTLIPRSKGNPSQAPVHVPHADVDRVERGSVLSFALRDDVLWHPLADEPAEHHFDADDVRFSWEIYGNPGVQCDDSRAQFQRVSSCEVVDSHYVRFFFAAQYAFAIRAIGTNLTILPRHVFDLSDPDNADFRETFGADEQAAYVNDHPRNRMWVGLGPYRVSTWTDQYVEVERFTDKHGKALYFDRSNAGYVDTIRYRVIADNIVAMGALLNGELDYFERMTPEDYFGGQSETDAFKSAFYKGFKFSGAFSYLVWNMRRPALKDKVVRDAIEQSIDMQHYLETSYRGLANRVTGSFPFNSAAYNHEVQPRPFDPEAAMAALDEAGWYDRNGDGTRDRNGVELKIGLLYPAGNTRSESFGSVMKESLDRIGIEVTLEPTEWVSLLERVNQGDFDGSSLALAPELESDPEPLYHSRWAATGKHSLNRSGLEDPEVDRLLEAGLGEADQIKRTEIWRALHRYLYEEVNPCLFQYQPAYKLAVSKKLRGVQFVAIDPGYVLRRWHRVDGTRTTLDR